MKIKWHSIPVILGLIASLLLAAMYWWSGDLVYPFCCEGGPPSRRDAAVKVAIKLPFLRKASLVSWHWKRGMVIDSLSWALTREQRLEAALRT